LKLLLTYLFLLLLNQFSLFNKLYSRERKQRVASDPEVTSRSVYVTGLAWETTDEELANHFAQVGPVVKATILRQHRRGSVKNSMGCGVVEFQFPASAAAAVTTFTESDLGGRRIRCREDRNPEDEYTALDGQERPPQDNKPKTSFATSVPMEDREVDPNRVFVSSLAWETTKEELASFFSAAGQVVSAEVLTTRKGRSMGSAIVEFSNEDSAVKSIDMFTDVMLNGRVIAVRKCYK